MYVIKWENKYSGETGYVKKINKKKSYFENTYDIDEAKTYKSLNGAENATKTLNELNDAGYNVYLVVAVGAEE